MLRSASSVFLRPFVNLPRAGAGRVSNTCIIGCALALTALFMPAGVKAGAAETVLYNFCSQTNCSDGAQPYAGVVMDSSGNLFGTTNQGGGGDCDGLPGCGIAFKLAPDGSETVLFSFSAETGGGNPAAGLIMDRKGNLYGTALRGGSQDDGAVFRIAPDGRESVLYSFVGGTDGANPYASLIMDKKGNLYGTTQAGGGGACAIANPGCGTVFELSLNGRSWIETVLHAFTGGDDGNFPIDALIIDKQGNLYGTTEYGGGVGCCGWGTVFEIAPDGSETKLYSFKDGKDGGLPYGGLVMDGSGNLYGTAAIGGAGTCSDAGPGCGTVYKVTPSGHETVLYSFSGGNDGGLPEATLVADKKGNLYSTAHSGGTAKSGVVFEIAPDGTETVLYNFCSRKNCGDGQFPCCASLVMDRRGDLYGTTEMGGSAGDGVVFKVTKR